MICLSCFWRTLVAEEVAYDGSDCCSGRNSLGEGSGGVCGMGVLSGVRAGVGRPCTSVTEDSPRLFADSPD